MSRRHIIISGTGRSGTTFLVQLFTALGMDTGFSDVSSGVHANCSGGMEWDLRHPRAPYIVKNPWLCDYLDEALAGGDIVVEHAIVPMRDLFAAAQSRRDVALRSNPDEFTPEQGIPGGLWHTERPEDQESVLTHQLYKLMFTLAKRDIPVTLLDFPRIVADPAYLHRKLGFALKGMPFADFKMAFDKVVQPALVHDFTPSTPSGTAV
jgi:hypothetical protein